MRVVLLNCSCKTKLCDQETAEAGGVLKTSLYKIPVATGENIQFSCFHRVQLARTYLLQPGPYPTEFHNFSGIYSLASEDSFFAIIS